jgi:uncharacterized protein YpmB
MSKQKLYAGLIGGVLMLGLTLSNQAMAGKDVKESELPEVVLKTFKEAYPNAKKVEWEHKKVHIGDLKGLPLYEVEFEDENGIDHENLYGADGKLYKSGIDD